MATQDFKEQVLRYLWLSVSKVGNVSLRKREGKKINKVEFINLFMCLKEFR